MLRRPNVILKDNIGRLLVKQRSGAPHQIAVDL